MKRTILAGITITLFAALSASALAQQSPGSRGEGMRGFQRLDSNGDNAVNTEEFMAPHTVRFEMLDLDADNCISAEEFAARRQARFEELDTNGNGVLEQDEFPMRGKMSGKKAGKKAGRKSDKKQGKHNERVGNQPE